MTWYKDLKDKASDGMDNLSDKANEGVDKMTDKVDKMNDGRNDLINDDPIDYHAKKTTNFLKRIFGDLSTKSVMKQIAVGGIVGGCSGALSCTFGLAAAIAVGVGLLLIQVAHHRQWINVPWGRVDGRVVRLKKNVQRHHAWDWNRTSTSIELFFRQNMFVCASFAGGVLIGAAAARGIATM